MTLLGHDSGWTRLQSVDISITSLRNLTPMMTYPRCPGTVERAFAPLVEYFGYQWAIGDKNDNRALYHFEPYLGPALAAAVEALQLWSTPVHVVDLHGDRARTARERLAQPLRGIRVIYFGKGAGVLATVFEEWAGRVSDELVVVGVSGYTDAEPVPSVGVVVPYRLVEALEAALDPSYAPQPDRRRQAAGKGARRPRADRHPRAMPGRTPAPQPPNAVTRPSRMRLWKVVTAALLLLWFLASLLRAAQC